MVVKKQCLPAMLLGINRLVLLLLFTAVCTAGCNTGTAPVIYPDVKDNNFKVGQIWTYKTRAGEEKSTLTVLKVEKFTNTDTIVHIRVDGVKVYSPAAPSGYSNEITHMPFQKKALLGSVVSVVGQNDTTLALLSGYAAWRNAKDSGKAGYFVINVQQAITGIDSVMRQQIKR